MTVKRTQHFTITATGPGVGQRDSWQADVPVEVRDLRGNVGPRATLVFKKTAGMSGQSCSVSLADLKELIRLVETHG